MTQTSLQKSYRQQSERILDSCDKFMSETCKTRKLIEKKSKKLQALLDENRKSVPVFVCSRDAFHNYEKSVYN
jgi:chromosome condensin MukBEF ATPase and DNA-binding subunit MukB